MSEADVITIDQGQMSGLDELSGAPPQLLNGLVMGAPGSTPLRAVRSRPGIRAWADLPAVSSTAPVVAMDFLGGRLVYITDDGAGLRQVFGIAGSSCVDMGALAPTTVDGFTSVTMVVWRDFAFACGGANIQKISRGFVSTKLGGSPPQAADLCVVAQRLVVISPDEYGLFFWNSVPGEAGVEQWDLSLDFREAEARADRLVACKEGTRELFMFGEQTVQVFAPDPDEIFTPAAALDIGCVAKRGVIRVDQQMAWLADKSRLVLSDGRTQTVISDLGMSATIKGIETVSDAWAFRCVIGNHDLYAWVFPTDGRTFVLDRNSQTWSEWRRKEAGTGRWLPWAPTCYLYVESLRIHLVGMADGTIAELTLDAHTDLEDPISWKIRTGFKDVTKRRHAVEARFTARRGEASSPTSSIAVSWRDDLGAFTPPIECSLGEPGDYTADIVVSPAGEPYRRRQWELSGSAADAYVIAAGKETFEEAEF